MPPRQFLSWSVGLALVSTPVWADGPAAGEPGPFAAVRSLNRDLLMHDSATEVLGQWCAGRRLADPPVIRAVRDSAPDKPADARVRARLGAARGETIRYRHVRLTCGAHVLSEADNWYRPALLTPGMNAALDHTDTPFGLVVKPLGFHRVRLGATFLIGRYGVAKAGGGVLRHEALLVMPNGEPFSLVVETYTAEVTFRASDR